MGWSIVQTKKGGGGSLVSGFAPFQAGSVLIGLLVTEFSVTVASISINSNFVSANCRSTVNVSGGTNLIGCEIWYLVLQPADVGLTSLLQSFSGGGGTDSFYFEIQGLDLSSPLDAVGTLNNGPSSNLSAPGASVVTRSDGDFVAAMLFVENNPALSISSGGLFTFDLDGGAGNGYAHLSSVFASRGTYTPQWTANSSMGQYCSSSAAFFATVPGRGALHVANDFDMTIDRY